MTPKCPKSYSLASPRSYDDIITKMAAWPAFIFKVKYLKFRPINVLPTNINTTPRIQKKT